MAKIAVTGVTGNLGGMVSRLCKMICIILNFWINWST